MTESKKSKVVRYTGRRGEREIDEAAWASVGATKQKKTVWKKNQAIDVSEFSKEALAYLEGDTGFTIE